MSEKKETLFGLRELHAYGGLIVVAIGGWTNQLGIAAVGAALWYMGTFRGR